MNENNLESGSHVSESGLPTPKFENASDKQPSMETTQELVNKLRPVIEDVVSRHLQSDKDRRINRMERQVGDFEERLARYDELRAAGLSNADARFRLQAEEIIAERTASARNSPRVPEADVTGITSAEGIAKMNALLKEAGLENDPEVANMLREKTYRNAGALVEDVARLVIRRNRPASPVIASQPTGGKPSGTEDEASLKASYEREKKNIRRGDVKGIFELQRKYRQKGLNV